MSPRDRHAAGSAPVPADQPWARTADRHVWRAYKNGLMLTVTEAIGGGWHPVVEGPGVTRHGPVGRARPRLVCRRLARGVPPGRVLAARAHRAPPGTA